MCLNMAYIYIYIYIYTSMVLVVYMQTYVDDFGGLPEDAARCLRQGVPACALGWCRWIWPAAKGAQGQRAEAWAPSLRLHVNVATRDSMAGCFSRCGQRRKFEKAKQLAASKPNVVTFFLPSMLYPLQLHRPVPKLGRLGRKTLTAIMRRDLAGCPERARKFYAFWLSLDREARVRTPKKFTEIVES